MLTCEEEFMDASACIQIIRDGFGKAHLRKETGGVHLPCHPEPPSLGEGSGRDVRIAARLLRGNKIARLSRILFD